MSDIFFIILCWLIPIILAICIVWFFILFNKAIKRTKELAKHAEEQFNPSNTISGYYELKEGASGNFTITWRSTTPKPKNIKVYIDDNCILDVKFPSE